MSVVNEKSSTGLDANIAGLLCYLVGFITGIVFLAIEKESKFVRFHAMQSTITFVGLFILQFALGIIPFLGWFVLVPILVLGELVIWALCMFKAYSGEWFKLPVVGDLAEKQIAAS